MPPQLNAVFAALARRQIAWALLRAPADVTSPDGGDIDVLVHTSGALKLEEAFRELGFVRLPRPGAHFVRYDPSSDQWLWFHVVQELSFGAGTRVATDAAEAALERRVTAADIPCLAPDDGFWTLLLHCALDKRSVAPRHQRTLQQLAASNPVTGPLAAFVARLCAAGSPPAAPGLLVGMAARGEWADVERALSRLASDWAGQHRPTRWVRLQSRCRRLWRVRSAGHDPGLTVALLGPDGAGKSTLAGGIAASSRLPVTLMYMGLTGGALKHAARLRVPGVVFGARALVIWYRYLRAQFHRSRGRLVVFDRYILDAAVPHPRRLNRAERLARWLDGYLCPLPDLVLVLDAPGELMYRRKGEYSAEVLEDWRRHFLAIRDRVPQVEVIDASRDREAVRVDAMSRIWRHYHARAAAARKASA